VIVCIGGVPVAFPAVIAALRMRPRRFSAGLIFG